MTPRIEVGRKPHILIVDSDLALCRTVSPLLMRADYEVSHAENGFEALLQIHTHPPDLIVSDLDMPDQAGLELASLLSRHCPNIPVIAVSGAEQGFLGVPANAFHIKGSSHAQDFMGTVAKLLAGDPKRTPQLHAPTPKQQEPQQGEAA